MLLKFAIFFLNTSLISASVLLWSNKDVKVPAMQQFDEQDLRELEKMIGGKVFVFSLDKELTDKYKGMIDQFYSSYIPGAYFETDDMIELSGEVDKDLKLIDENLRDAENFLAVIVYPSPRYKREVEVEETKDKIPTGPVLYSGQSKNFLYTLLYSSKPLMLVYNESKLYLGNTSPDMITVDTRLNVRIPIEDKHQITLRFFFNWIKGYWYMTGVRIQDTNNVINLNLTISKEIYSAAKFSYHCAGETKFTDKDFNELVIYDMQVQIDSNSEKFDDAYDCVNFMTIPIWSGIMVTALLGFGLAIALTAIMDIKAMDKFDNHKTKNLAITIMD